MTPLALHEALTPTALLTVLTDMGTEQAFRDNKCLQPRARFITPKGGKRSFLRLWIRGMKETKAYPCLDELGIRDEMCTLFNKVSESRCPYRFTMLERNQKLDRASMKGRHSRCTGHHCSIHLPSVTTLRVSQWSSVDSSH